MWRYSLSPAEEELHRTVLLHARTARSLCSSHAHKKAAIAPGLFCSQYPWRTCASLVNRRRRRESKDGV